MELISRDELLALKQRNNLTAVTHLTLRLLFHVIFVMASMYLVNSGSVIWGLLVLAPHCAAMAFLGWAGIGHELFHNSVFTSRRVNTFFFRLFSVLTWNNYAYFQISHPYHHRHTLEKDDAEGEKHPSISLLGILWLLTFDAPGFFRRLRILSVNALGTVPGGRAGASMFPEGSRQKAELVAGARTVLLVQGLLFLTFAMLGLYWLILAVNMAPFCVTFFNRMLAISQHYDLRSQGPRDFLNSCRTVKLGPVFEFFYASMNYHVEHHMYPGVPYYNLGKLSLLMKSRAPYPNLTYGYYSTLRELSTRGLFGKWGLN
tara:strand:+ start:1686 stop:2633 length:948 start_codon:yes stop_codon:yes gene_type:complete